MIRDIVRAVLVLVVLAVGCEILAVHGQRRPPPAVVTSAPMPPTWPPQPVQWQPAPAPAPPPGPIRRVAREVVELTEAVIGVIR
jgi:hypothetical protein